MPRSRRSAEALLISLFLAAPVALALETDREQTMQIDADHADGNAAALFHLLDTWGYTAHLWRRGACVPWRAGQTSVDYIFLPRPEAPSP